MRQFIPLALIAVASATLLAQPRAGIVEVTASRQLLLAPAQVRFSIFATTGQEVGVAAVTSALREVGLTEDHLISASVGAKRADYTFELSVPPARLESITKALQAGEKNPPSPLSGLGFYYGSEPADAPIAEARLRLLPELFQAARAKAERQLAAAGQSPGTILALSDQTEITSDSASATFSLFLRMAALGAPSTQPRSITVQAIERSRPGPFDQATISVSLRLNLDEGRSKAFALVEPLGMTEADLVRETYVRGFGEFILGLIQPPPRTFQFLTTRPASEVKSFLAKASSTASDRIGVLISLSHSDAAIDRDQQRAVSSLLSSARSRAEPLAALLGLPLRLPRSLSSSPGDPLANRGQLTFASGSFDFPASSVRPPGRGLWNSLVVEFGLD